MAVTQKFVCSVEQVVDHGDRVYTVVLKPDRAVPRFRAGQFLHLALDPYDPTRFWPESRPFSIASTPSRRDLLRISYSVRGQFTTRMEAELIEGRDVWIKMPYGDFIVDRRTDIVLFAGGTGITAFTAFLEGLASEEPLPAEVPYLVVLAYGARTSRLLIYREMVEGWARSASSIDVSYFVEDGSTAHSGGSSEQVSAQVGRVSVAAVWPRVRRPLEATYYLAGPPAMLQTISTDLKANRISPEAIHIDAWE